MANDWRFTVAFIGLIVFSLLQEKRVLVTFNRSPAESMDAGSRYLILFGNCFAVIAAVVYAIKVPAAGLHAQGVLFWVGVSIFISGMMLRRYCFELLGSSFTAAVVVVPGQHIVDSGIYQYVRHPSYSGTMLQFLGFGLALANWVSVLILVAVAAGVLLRRSIVEEKAFVKVLGDPYVRYMGRTRRFIPFVF